MKKMSKFLKIFLVAVGAVIIALAIFIIEYHPQATTPVAIIPSPKKETSKKVQETTFVIAGDAMFGRAIYYKYHDDLKAAFANLGEGFFSGRDVAMLNLEGPIVEEEFTPDINPDNLIMKFPLQTVGVLKWLGLNAVSLANNHTQNQGREVLDFTRQILGENQITPVGDPQNETDLVKTFTKNEQKISVIAVDILANTPNLTDLIKEQKDNFTIIFPHWGGEYGTTHNSTQEELAHTWIDAGADLVAGAHPHVIQDAEMYNSKPIFYSLGNFLFDQTFSQNTQRGLILDGKITSEKLTLKMIPIISNASPQVLEGVEKDEIIADLKKSLGDETAGDSIELELTK